jgi:N-acetylglutamate synthase-like GNAT family acetyltransferase
MMRRSVVALDGRARSEGFLAQPNILLVGAVNERVVAFAHAVPATVPDMAELTGFYCHPDAWGSGISAALMTPTKAALADRVSEMFLWTLRDSARARRFYEKVGFRLTGSTRCETLTNWTTDAAAERSAVEYATTLAH